MSVADEMPDRLQHLSNLWPLRKIAEDLSVEVNTMYRWADRRDQVGFPVPKKKLGRYNLYDQTEVEDWYYLWRRIHTNMTNGGSNG